MHLKFKKLKLTCLFHTGSWRGSMNPDADKEGDGRLYVSYCPRSNSRLMQYPSGVRKLQQNRYEIFGLKENHLLAKTVLILIAFFSSPFSIQGQESADNPAQIFHANRYVEAAKADEARKASILIPDSSGAYSPNQNGSLIQHPSLFPISTGDDNELSGLADDDIKTITDSKNDIVNEKDMDHVTIDIRDVPYDKYEVTAETIILIKNRNALKLIVHSTIYPNIYPNSIGWGSLRNHFIPSNLETINPEILDHPLSEYGKNTDEIWIPKSKGDVTLNFEGDLVVKNGSLIPYREREIRHVTIFVPIQVIE